MADATTIMGQISTALDALATQLFNIIPNDQSFMETWGWNLPAINRTEFADYIRTPIRLINDLPIKEVSEADAQALTQFPSRIAYFQAHSLPQLPGGNAFHVYLTARSLIDRLIELLSKYMKTEIDWGSPEAESLLPTSQLRRLRQTQKGLERLTKDSEQLKEQILEINSAYKAAKELPTSLAELSDARADYKIAIDDLTQSAQQINDARLSAETQLEALNTLRINADQQMKNLDAAYSAATTQGLGKAFGDKAQRLSRSTWGLFLALAITLSIGAYITSGRISWLHVIMEKPNVSLSLLWVNVWLTVASVAGPIWFGWLLTKQIGQRFRLAEDYDFKASVAKAYEGYRREAVNIDPEQGKRLFAMALDRLSEEPLRHIERQTHGSPLHELIGNVISKKKSEKQPDFGANNE